jgi:hypothetical protein
MPGVGSEPASDERSDGPAAVAAVLWSVPLFNACGPTEIDAASRLLHLRTEVAGARLGAAELATHSFLVVGGQALATDDSGTTTRLGPGDLFGLLRFAVAERQTAAVVALTTLRLLVADEDATVRMLSLDGIAGAVVHGAATRRRAGLLRQDGWAAQPAESPRRYCSLVPADVVPGRHQGWAPPGGVPGGR